MMCEQKIKLALDLVRENPDVVLSVYITPENVVVEAFSGNGYKETGGEMHDYKAANLGLDMVEAVKAVIDPHTIIAEEAAKITDLDWSQLI